MKEKGLGLSLLLVFLLVLAACGSNPIRSGTVIDKQHTSARDWNTTVEEQRCSGTGFSLPRYGGVHENEICLWIPVTNHHHQDEQWLLKLKHCEWNTDKGENVCKTSDWINVTQTTYDSVKLNDQITLH